MSEIDASIERGVELEEAGQLDEAEAVYKEILAASPRHPLATYNLGVVYFRANRIDDAIAAFTAAIDANPKNHSAWYNRGVCSSQKGKALGSFRANMDGLTVIGGGGAAMFENAIADYTRAIEIGERSHYLVNRANALHALGRDPAAIVDLRRAAQLGNPKALPMLKDVFGLES